jgi:hypothetical protein
LSVVIKRRRKMAYTSVEPRKSARERYIRVAAMDIVTRTGIENIWSSRPA